MSYNFEYFYGTEAEHFIFFRIPKVLITDSRFKVMSTDSKLLYGLMLDRMGLSNRNGWVDEHNRVYIIYTMEEIIEDMGCARQKAAKLLDELDMVDVVCSKEETIRINKQEYPQTVVKSRFLKIDSSHIEYIYFALSENASNVRNIRAFLITTIYRAPETTDNWYSAKVKHDMANWG